MDEEATRQFIEDITDAVLMDTRDWYYTEKELLAHPEIGPERERRKFLKKMRSN